MEASGLHLQNPTGKGLAVLNWWLDRGKGGTHNPFWNSTKKGISNNSICLNLPLQWVPWNDAKGLFVSPSNFSYRYIYIYTNKQIHFTRRWTMDWKSLLVNEVRCHSLYIETDDELCFLPYLIFICLWTCCRASQQDQHISYHAGFGFYLHILHTMIPGSFIF